MIKPRFKHDCEKCKFIGDFEGGDMYVCGTPNRHSLVVRYSSDGPNYASYSSRILDNPIYNHTETVKEMIRIRDEFFKLKLMND